MNEHTIEPNPSTILYGDGEFIGEDAAKCASCGQDITGNENGWDHYTMDEGR